MVKMLLFMLCPFIPVILIVFVLLFEGLECINWNPYKPKYSEKLTEFKIFNAKMQVPADYDNPKAHGNFNIHVRKICHGSNPHPKTHLIALQGGPAQQSTVFEEAGFLGEMVQAMGSRSFCLYIIDHRGVEGSSRPDFYMKLNKAFDEGNVEEIKKSDFPLFTLTISNAAKDLLKLASLIKQEYAFKDPNSYIPFTLLLWAVSYGTLWGHRAMIIDPEMFDGAILQGFSRYERVSIDSDEGFLYDCYKSKTCMKFTDNHPERLRNLVSYLAEHTPAENKCTKILENFLKSKSGYSQRNEQADEGEGEEEISPSPLATYYDIKERADDKERKIMATLLYNYKCPDPKLFSKLIEEKFNAPEAHEATSYEETYITTLINLSEIWKGQIENFPQFCQYKYTMGLVDDCKYLPGYKDQIESLKEILYKTDEFYNEELVTKKTKIFILQGDSDLITSVKQAKREFERIKAPSKTFIILKHSTHAVSEDTEVMREIINEIASKYDNSTRIKKKVEQENNFEVDEDFSLKPKPSSLFDLPEQVPKHYWPSLSDERNVIERSNPLATIPNQTIGKVDKERGVSGIIANNPGFDPNTWIEYINISNPPLQSEMDKIIDLRRQKKMAKEEIKSTIKDLKPIINQTKPTIKDLKPIPSTKQMEKMNESSSSTLGSQVSLGKVIQSSKMPLISTKSEQAAAKNVTKTSPLSKKSNISSEMRDHVNLLQWLVTL